MSEALPQFSVVIPAYNAAAFIEETLETVAAQTCRDFEVIVVDDGSADDTHGVVARFLRAGGLSGLCLRQQNKGIAAARNAGVAQARGKYVAFLDHDDAWYPKKLEVVLREFADHREAGLVCHNQNITEGGRLLRVARYGPWTQDMYERLLLTGNALSPSCVTVLRAKILEIRGFRENPEFNTVEDYDLWMRLSQACRFRFIEEVLGEYRFEERGASRRVVYHHTNLEHLLRDHFRTAYGESPSLITRLKMRRRLSSVYRSALGLLMKFPSSRELERDYALRMLRAFPFDPKNAVRALQWAGRSMRSLLGP